MKKDLLVPINRNFGKTPDYIPNISPYIQKELEKISQPGRHTNDYVVPYMWGTAILYFNKKFKTLEDSQFLGMPSGMPSTVAKILMKDSYRAIDKMLHERGLNESLPVFVSEMGIYPGPLADDYNSMDDDRVRQAVGMLSLFYWYGKSKYIYPFNWVIRHHLEGRKDMLFTADDRTLLSSHNSPPMAKPSESSLCRPIRPFPSAIRNRKMGKDSMCKQPLIMIKSPCYFGIISKWDDMLWLLALS